MKSLRAGARKPFFEIGSATDAGIRRGDQPNQDRVGAAPHALWGWNMPLLIVADGMGGYAGGALASRIVVDIFTDEYKRLNLYANTGAFLSRLVNLAHRNIKKQGASDKDLAQMGSTVVAACLEQDKVTVLNVGDSRAYLFRGEQVIRLGQDQSWVGEQVRAGQLTEEEALAHPNRSKLSMAISARRETVTPVISTHNLDAKDILLLCSDGLWAVVPEQVIQAAVKEMSSQKAANHLIQLANEAGGPDNVSVVIAKRA